MYTGNTKKYMNFLQIFSVYPCVYREHQLDTIVAGKKAGLSLCIQGTHLLLKMSGTEVRFIPVYTGNTTVLNSSCTMCCGLSLCIQGTPERWKKSANKIWFIPVYTGNTPIITYCFIIKILTVKFLPIF